MRFERSAPLCASGALVSSAMSSNIAADGSGIDSEALADALRGLAAALEAAPESVDAKQKSNSEARAPEEAKSRGSGDHECTCGRRFESAAKLAGHIGGSAKGSHGVAGSETPNSGDSSSDEPKELIKMARSLHPDTDAAKALLRDAKAGGEIWAATFGRCGEEGCEYGANGFDASLCQRHAREASDEGTDEATSDDPNTWLVA